MSAFATSARFAVGTCAASVVASEAAVDPETGGLGLPSAFAAAAERSAGTALPSSAGQASAAASEAGSFTTSEAPTGSAQMMGWLSTGPDTVRRDTSIAAWSVKRRSSAYFCQSGALLLATTGQ